MTFAPASLSRRRPLKKHWQNAIVEGRFTYSGGPGGVGVHDGSAAEYLSIGSDK
jgi:hypothetical protein